MRYLFWFCPHYTKHNVKVYCDAHDEESGTSFTGPFQKASRRERRYK
jgi:hypothetical protein